LPKRCNWRMLFPMQPKAILLDLDGVLYIGDRPIEGAAEAIARLQAAGIRLAGITNTTTRPRRAIAKRLQAIGIELDPSSIYTPAMLAAHEIGNRRAWLCVREALLEDFAGVVQDEANPEVVVMGDVGGDGYPPALLQRVFRHVFAGAQLIALHKNRFWRTEEGLTLDLGAWVAAIEYATGKEALVLGKPSRAFFLAVCTAIGAHPEQTWIVGDDIEADIGGAQRAGITACLVHTGKYRAEFVRQSGIVPDCEIPSIADLPALLGIDAR